MFLVTGGAGFIGSWTVKKLLEKRFSVVVLDNLSTGNIENLPCCDSLSFIKGDIRDKDLIDWLFKKHKFCGVFHLASLISVEESLRLPCFYFDVNVNGTLNILQASVKYKVKKMLFASSASVYGDPTKLPISEDVPLLPINVYGLTKLAGENLLRIYFKEFGSPDYIILRYFNVYGPLQSIKGGYAAVIPAFITAALSNRPFTVYGDGKQTRDFIFVEDVARISVDIMLSPLKNKIFNVASGKQTSIMQLIDVICDILNIKKPSLCFCTARKGDITHSYASIDLLKSCFSHSFLPKTDLKEGIKKTVDWFKSVLH